MNENIEKFGGDPNNIILLGGSAGANLIDMLMISPKAKGLFHRAISMSYSIDPVGGVQDYIAKKNSGNNLVKNKTDLELLRTLTPDELMKKPESLLAMVTAGSCVDNVYINGVWRDEIALGKINDINYLILFSSL